MNAFSNTGVRAGIAAALLFGAGTPVAKLLLDDISPWLLAGILYTGSGLGLGLYRVVRRAPRVRLRPARNVMECFHDETVRLLRDRRGQDPGSDCL
ncbi:hypothetical protein [Aeromicrobium sp.]